MATTRRTFLTGALAAETTVPLAGWGQLACEPGRGRPRPPAALPDGLFSLGVASGDPLPTAVVLWTRLAPAPTAGGGMPAVHVPVRWEVATDDGFRDVVRRGTAVARPVGHSVHVDVGRLHPGVGTSTGSGSATSSARSERTRTAPAEVATGDRLRFLFGSCQGGRATGRCGRAPPRTTPTWVLPGRLHLRGARRPGRASSGPTTGRDRDPGRLPQPLRAVQGRPGAAGHPRRLPVGRHLGRPPRSETTTPGSPPGSSPRAPAFPARRAAAYQAWWEHMPVRLPAPTGPDLAIYRSLDWGRLARFHVLDTRQYRSDQPCGDGTGPTCPERTDPAGPPAPTRRRGSARAWRRPGPPGTCWPTRSS